ncbi:MAG: hypothetical protein HKN63_07135 [Rhodobacteraceae bacterium]|nr:hypothetical protein [Paracoccaceae bacterium]
MTGRRADLRLLLALAATGALAACGPMSPERAGDICQERARAATGPTGELAIGTGTGGLKSKVEVGISSDFIQGRDPYEVYESCVRQKTGQGPIRPLNLG